MSKIDPVVTYRTGIAGNSKSICVSAAIDAFDADEPYTRVMTYSERDQHLWRFHEEDYIVASLCVWRPAPGQSGCYVTLSEEGDVVLMFETFNRERIAGAGLNRDDSLGWGYMADVQQIGAHLYACGFSGQVYRRRSPNQWEHIDAGLLQPAAQEGGEFSAQVINGPHEHAIYLAGCEHLPGYPVRADYWNGKGWQRLTLPKRSSRITNLFVESEERIWMCGDNGTLLLGNANAGFMQLNAPHDKQLFLSLCKFQERIYLGSNLGLFFYDPAVPAQGIRKVRTRLKPDLQDTNIVQAVGDVMWSMGPKDIARFDGAKWDRIDSPDNPKI